MTQASAHESLREYTIPGAPELPRDAVDFPESGAQRISAAMFFVGAVAFVATFIAGFAIGGYGLRHALASYLVGFSFALTLALGSLGWVMIFQQTNAGWSAAIRRFFENAASLIPGVLVLFLPILLSVFFARGALYSWMDPEYVAGDVIYDHKAPYLNVGFFVFRSLLYFAVWVWLAGSIYRWSVEQDRTGDRWLTARMRRRSSYGLILLALTAAFAAFDWLMSLDFHWFSTIFGVYIFAGSLLSSMAMLVLLVVFLQRSGRLRGVVTEEHFHDVGKLIFAFTVFWAYIAFSQYFLIWYSNIPEETAWYLHRKSHGWEGVGQLLIWGHFVVPFFFLLWRRIKRNPAMLAVLAVWILFIHAVDLFYLVRPAVYKDTMGMQYFWLDLLGFAAPVCIFLGLLVRRLAQSPLVPIKDPRLHESLHHKNYV